MLLITPCFVFIPCGMFMALFQKNINIWKYLGKNCTNVGLCLLYNNILQKVSIIQNYIFFFSPEPYKT